MITSAACPILLLLPSTLNITALFFLLASLLSHYAAKCSVKDSASSFFGSTSTYIEQGSDFRTGKIKQVGSELMDYTSEQMKAERVTQKKNKQKTD